MNKKEKNFLFRIDEVKDKIKKRVPLAEISRDLNLKYDTFRKYLLKYDVPFQTNQNREGIPHCEARKDASYYFDNKKTITASKLRQLLIRDGYKEERCECCKLTEWMGKPIPLELHHKDGNHYNNSLDNLEILCSNCHMQAHNYSNIKKEDLK